MLYTQVTSFPPPESCQKGLGYTGLQLWHTGGIQAVFMRGREIVEKISE